MVESPVNLDMDVLRTFVAGIELGSFARAAERVGRSPSAVSLQLRKLEEQVGQTLFEKKGRGLALTEAGEILLGYARRMLDLNDEARTALSGLSALEGWVRIGIPQDFAETWLPDLLARFQRAHPKTRVEARVDRGTHLVEAVDTGTLDLALTWGRLGNARAEVLQERQVVWIGPASYACDVAEPFPLVAFDEPCMFRRAAIAALEREKIAWRHVFASPSLSGLWAAVSAGLGVTARTLEGKPPGLSLIDAREAGLPELGSIELAIHGKGGKAGPQVGELTKLIREAVAYR
ncbi:LysR substrate-binding domain-containing protein [Hongsoonwoonella zoysiae]|uniref:LysR substrate-binding domain-containing protein n=1 Tax=Hongsoonwoonella zoysiae TaxID=2821844 RepID=UPI001FE39D15|nr:LysR substrate-binding domain-containing protein [Hongsoonwoonella zoysiae]